MTPLAPRRGEDVPYKPIAGVVPCRGGWLVQAGRLQGISLFPMATTVFPTLIDILDWKPAFHVVAVHIPLGLPGKEVQGMRGCDTEARSLLGRARGAAVLPAPSRFAIDASTFDEAQELNNGMGLAVWRLLPKIREAAKEIQSYNQRVIYEVHPELSFMELNGGTPMEFSKRSLRGMSERRQLLLDRVQNMDRMINVHVRGVPEHKILDASIGLWSARRIMARGAAARIPDIPQWDDEGMRMEIWR